MLVLAIETSHEPGSIALLRDGILLEECSLSADRRRGQSLILEIQRLFFRHSLVPNQTGLVAVGIGPGSFTGLRVGIVAAKTIAYACGIPVAAFPTLHAIVGNVPPEICRATVAIDAQRKELFLQTFERDPGGRWISVTEIDIRPFDDWLRTLSHGEAVLGPGLEPFRELLAGKCRLLEDSTWMPRASLVGQLAADSQFHQSAWDLLPLYVRKSTAEETWDQRQGAQSFEQPNSNATKCP